MDNRIVVSDETAADIDKLLQAIMDYFKLLKMEEEEEE